MGGKLKSSKNCLMNLSGNINVIIKTHTGMTFSVFSQCKNTSFYIELYIIFRYCGGQVKEHYEADFGFSCSFQTPMCQTFHPPKTAVGICHDRPCSGIVVNGESGSKGCCDFALNDISS